MAEDLPLKPTAVLIEWTGDNLKYIADKVFLNTGINEIPAADWERLRWMVADLIVDPAKLRESERKEGRIIEKFATVEAPKPPKDDKTPVDTKSTIKAAKSINDPHDLDALAAIDATTPIPTQTKRTTTSGNATIPPPNTHHTETINKAD